MCIKPESVIELESSILYIEEFLKTAPKRIDELTKELSACDLEVSDLQHFMEFVDLNASEGFRAYKELQDTLKRRRIIKDELQVLQSTHARFNPIFGSTAMLQKMSDNVKANGKGKDNRLYTPRIRKDLMDRINNSQTKVREVI